MMRHLPIKLLITFFIVLPSLSWALPSDRQKPIDIEADHAQLDDERGVTQYKGDAILTQGTLKIEGDIITFYYDEDKQLTKAVAQGKYAKYQQIQKPGETPVKARALQMEYHAQSQKIYLIGKGHVWQNGDEFSGARIEYDITKNIVNASSKPVKTENGEKPRKGERIHIIIQPPGSKKKTSSTKVTNTKVIKKAEPTTTPQKKNTGYPTATTTTNLNIRTGPGTQYTKIATFNVGTLLYILTEQKDWLQVRGTVGEQAVIGWVSRRYIQAAN